MILIDANLLIYAHVPHVKEHVRAREWFAHVMGTPAEVCLAWPVIVAFLRITTNARIFTAPASPADACLIVASWLERRPRLLTPGDRHWQILQELISESQALGNIVGDAHIAALALEHGATLASCDRDFRRFKGLKVFDPLG